MSKVNFILTNEKMLEKSCQWVATVTPGENRMNKLVTPGENRMNKLNLPKFCLMLIESKKIPKG